MEESTIREQRRQLDSVIISQEAEWWIPDTGSTRTPANKYARTLDLYWHSKALLAKLR